MSQFASSVPQFLVSTFKKFCNFAYLQKYRCFPFHGFSIWSRTVLTSYTNTFWIFREPHCLISGLVRCLEVGDEVSKVPPSGKQPNPVVQYDSLERSLSQASNTLSPLPAVAFSTNIQSKIAISSHIIYWDFMVITDTIVRITYFYSEICIQVSNCKWKHNDINFKYLVAWFMCVSRQFYTNPRKLLRLLL
jgi:hypothetical protein